MQRLAGQIGLALEADLELALACHDHLDEVHRVEPETPIAQRRVGAGVGRGPRRARDPDRDRLDTLENKLLGGLDGQERRNLRDYLDRILERLD